MPKRIDPVRIQVSLVGPRKVVRILSAAEKEALVREWAESWRLPKGIRVRAVTWSNPARSKVKDRSPRTGPVERARQTLRGLLRKAPLSAA